MEFSSLIFLFLFLPVFLILFFSVRKFARNLFLLAASLVFYAWGEGQYVLLLLVSIIVNYLFGFLVDKTEGKPFRKAIFVVAVIFNVGLLVFFKYTHFILENLNIPGPATPIHLPVGISFFTFQALSYIIDIYRKTVPNDRNPVNFGLYMSFFPKLITGPIIHYHNLSKQISTRAFGIDDLSEGIRRFIIGLGKKVLIADTVARTANQVFAVPVGQQTAGLAWLGIFAYTLQIYFDFSGYSDMAIGIGRMCGFKLPENFNYPYISKSIKEFWTRWHISLAIWLRDYLFLPIAYSMLRKIEKDRLLRIKAEDWAYYTGTFITFLLCGIWHGANWTFVLWGVFYGVLLIIEHAGMRKFMKRKIPFVRMFYTQLMVMIAWVFFRSETLPYAFSYIKTMFGFGSGDGVLYYPALFLDGDVIFFMVIGIAGSFPLFPRLKAWFDASVSRREKREGNTSVYILKTGFAVVYNLYLTVVLLLSVIVMAAGTYNPFIYFRF
jgi:alginate O-acetyltransferase complex protein AlgI